MATALAVTVVVCEGDRVAVKTVELVWDVEHACVLVELCVCEGDAS